MVSVGNEFVCRCHIVSSRNDDINNSGGDDTDKVVKKHKQSLSPDVSLVILAINPINGPTKETSIVLCNNFSPVSPNHRDRVLLEVGKRG